MNRICALLILGALAACKPLTSRVFPDRVELAPPLHPQIALFINQYKSGPNQGALLRPNLSAWTPEVKRKYRTSTNPEGRPPYSATLEYLGRKSGADIYSVTFSYPLTEGSVTVTKEIGFSGSEVEIFKDDQYRIGLRPDSTNEAEESNRAASGPVGS